MVVEEIDFGFSFFGRLRGKVGGRRRRGDKVFFSFSFRFFFLRVLKVAGKRKPLSSDRPAALEALPLALPLLLLLLALLLVVTHLVVVAAVAVYLAGRFGLPGQPR